MNRHILGNRVTISLSLTLLISIGWLPFSEKASGANAPADLAPAYSTDSTLKPLNSDKGIQARIGESFGKLPLSFEANRGQAISNFDFLSRAEGYNLLIGATETVIAMTGPASKRGKAVKGSLLRMNLIGASPSAPAQGLDLLPGTSNYFFGNDAKRWKTGIPNYSRVQYEDIYPGVDVIYYGNRRQLEYDFIVAPGASFRAIRLKFDGARRMRVDRDGDLLLKTSAGEMRHRKPVAYQQIDGARREVEARYVLKGRRQVGFEIGAYDPSKPLVIDPVLSYSTFLGGTNEDEARDIAVDSSGNAYVTGRTVSFNFPVTVGAFNTTFAGSFDAFVTKMNSDGSNIIYSTYLGGMQTDEGGGIALDSSGNAYVAGYTGSDEFPTTPGAFQTVKQQGAFNGFITKLNSTGSGLIYSTFLGGNDDDQAFAIALDSANNAYVTGSAISHNFPTTPGAFQTIFGGGSGFQNGDAFVSKLNDTGTALIYSTYLGGSGGEFGNSIYVDASGLAYVAGNTRSPNFDTTPGAFQTTYGGPVSSFGSGDAFVTKLNNNGTALSYSTYLGGAGGDDGRGIAVNLAGEAYVVGSASSLNFPTTGGTVRVINGGAAKTTDGGASWAAINSGMTSPSVLSIVIDPASPQVVYMGTEDGVFKSTDGGANWTAINTGLTDLIINSLAIDPANTSTIYLGTQGRGIFKSTNSGASWAAINTGQNGMQVNSIAINQATPSTIYIATGSGIFKTVNGGANWTAINNGIQPFNANVVIIDPTAPSTLYAGMSNGAFKSTTAGSSWSPTGLNSVPVKALAINAAVPSQILAGSFNGIMETSDSGTTWRGINTGLTNRDINTIAISPGNPAVIYTGTDGGVFKSTDGGQIWSPLNAGLTGAQINALALHPTDASIIYAGTASAGADGFITRLSSGGNSLVYSTLLGGNNTDQAFAIALDSSGNAYITGATRSRSFPITIGSLTGFPQDFNSDAFASKLSPSASSLVYSSLLGGFNTDTGFAIALDSSNSAYVAGATASSDYPVTSGAFQATLNSSTDVFITKIVPTPSLTADFGVTMTATPSGTTPGSSIEYNITLTNNGPDPITRVRVVNDLPSSLDLSFCSIASEVGFCNELSNGVIFTINRLEPGASVSMRVEARIDCSIPSTTVITNTVMVESNALDSNSSNNTAQAQINATNPPTSLNPTNQAFPFSGGTGTVSVNRGVNCNWLAVSNDSWITITSSTGCCNGFVDYSVASNPGPARTGTLTIAGQTFTVNQAANAGTYSVSGNVANVNGLGITGVTMTFTRVTSGGVLPAHVVTNTNGDWGQSGFTDGNTYIVTPSKLRYTFSPPTRQFSSTTSSLNFVGTRRPDTTGVFRPSNGAIFLKNSNDSGFADIALTFGSPGDLPVSGDWDGDGIDTIGVYRNGTFFLRNSNTNGFADIVATFGAAGDLPVVGDWNNDGIDTIGVYRNGTFFLRNSNTSGGSNITFELGVAGDVPIAGDWDGDGVVTTGVFRPSNGALFLKNNNSTGFADIALTYGLPGDRPVTGDWNGDGIDTIGVYREGTFFLRNSNTNGFADLVFSLGVNGDFPFSGDWNGLP